MDAASIAQLNALNKAFYASSAEEFDQTRGRAWAGWLRLPQHLPARDPLRVLDVGCGNGRLGRYLAEAQPAALEYHGLDNSPELLTAARAALKDLPRLCLTLEEQDIVEHPPAAGAYDLVACFGVLHHIPGAATRRAFVQALAQRVAPGGLLAFACWRFYEYERFRARLAPWPSDIAAEPGDYLLDWRRGARVLRYCHYVDDAEHDALVAATGLDEIARYRADGFAGDVNQYSLLRAQA